jgi:hypothetical protein
VLAKTDKKRKHEKRIHSSHITRAEDQALPRGSYQEDENEVYLDLSNGTFDNEINFAE